MTRRVEGNSNWGTALNGQLGSLQKLDFWMIARRSCCHWLVKSLVWWRKIRPMSTRTDRRKNNTRGSRTHQYQRRKKERKSREDLRCHEMSFKYLFDYVQLLWISLL